MGALLGTWSAMTATKPRRIEGHTSNTEHPILYAQYLKGVIGETTEAGDTYFLPHKLTTVYSINATPLVAVAASNFINGNGTTVGCWYADAATVAGPTQITTAASAGASTIVLTAMTDIADCVNFCWIDILYTSGNKQTVQVTDFAVTTLVATLAEPITEAIAATGTYYTVRGTLITVPTAAVTPTLGFEVIGTFE